MQKETLEIVKKIAVKELPALIGMKGDVHISEINKNNGIKLTGICFRPEGSNVSPTVYAEHILKNDPYEAVNEIAEVIKHHIVEKVDVVQYFSEESVKKNLVLRLVNREKNEELLKNIPHRTVWGDLAEYISLHLEELEGEIKITNDIINRGMISFTVDEMFEIAHANTAEKMQVHDVVDFLSDKFDQDLSEMMPRGIMSVISNKESNYGAATILGNLDKFGDDYYIIPSSVHELIVIPNNGPVEVLNDMIKCVNDTQVLPQDVLSGHAYHVVNGRMVQDEMAA